MENTEFGNLKKMSIHHCFTAILISASVLMLSGSGLAQMPEPEISAEEMEFLKNVPMFPPNLLCKAWQSEEFHDHVAWAEDLAISAKHFRVNPQTGDSREKREALFELQGHAVTLITTFQIAKLACDMFKPIERQVLTVDDLDAEAKFFNMLNLKIRVQEEQLQSRVKLAE